MSEASNRMRAEWSVSDAKRDAGLKTPDSIQRFDNIQYGPDDEWNLLDVYRLKEATGDMPAILIVHGGGWVYGSKEIYQFYGMSLAERGFVVVNASYRLAPENKFPAQPEDINKMVEWMYDNAQSYGIDMQKVFLVGDSAGAHLAALYADICTNKEYANSYAFTVPKGFVPKALALNCGVFNPIHVVDGKACFDDDHEELMGDLLPNGGSIEEAELVNTVKHITPAFPPTYLMTAIGDFCLPNATAVEDALKKNGVDYIFKIYGSEDKPLFHVFHVDQRNEQGKLCNDEECQFFKMHLK